MDGHRPFRRVALCCAALALLAAALTGCGLTRHAVPGKLVEKAEIPGMPNIRGFGDEFSPVLQASGVEAVRQEPPGEFPPLPDGREVRDYLVLSGGGSDGAFGAGFLCGWTKAGTRPKFKLVTGISTGALLAPFAFLGPEYDQKLKDAYTTLSSDDIYRNRWLVRIPWAPSFADTTPMARVIEKWITRDVMEAVAREHLKGRRLLIGTTNLDCQRLVIWDMGAIATSGKPGALDLFRHVMRASASIPGMFPPVFFPVEADGRKYDEMHVDGGVTTQLFLYGFAVNVREAAKSLDIDPTERVRRLWIIRNGKVRASWHEIRPRLAPITGRAISGLIAFQAVGDLYRVFAISVQDGVQFRWVCIPQDFVEGTDAMFDHKEMSRLFNVGYEMAQQADPWEKLPPGMRADSPAATGAK